MTKFAVFLKTTISFLYFFSPEFEKLMEMQRKVQEAKAAKERLLADIVSDRQM